LPSSSASSAIATSAPPQGAGTRQPNSLAKTPLLVDAARRFIAAMKERRRFGNRCPAKVPSAFGVARNAAERHEIAAQCPTGHVFFLLDCCPAAAILHPVRSLSAVWVDQIDLGSTELLRESRRHLDFLRGQLRAADHALDAAKMCIDESRELLVQFSHVK
jgi:hypothetical protein